MAYLNTHARTVSNSDTFTPAGRTAALYGVFVGFVKEATDVQKNGRLRVWIPELGSAPDNPDGWVIVNYCSPFAGATNVDANSKADIESFRGTQTSYGMWMIPPDINNQVLVMFVNGDASRGIWIGSLFNQYMNNMVPGVPADSKNYQFPGKRVPVAEYNKWDTKVTQPDRAFHPYEQTKFRGVSNQGLINDPKRGTTTSGARREAPSQVYGILTPGPAINPDVEPEQIKRKGGSSFVMDDGIGTEYISLATKSGAQIRIDETDGFIYVINKDGTGWIQIDYEGNIDIFGARDISLRAQRDFNIRADRNINIEAGQNIFMKAAKDTKQEKTTFNYDVNNLPKFKEIPVWSYVGEGKGQGGNIVMQALNNWQSTTQKSAFLTVVENNLDIKVENAFALTTVKGGQDYNSKQGIKITTDAAVDLGAKGNIRVGSEGTISVVGIGGIIHCTQGNMSLKAMGNIIEAAGGTYYLAASSAGIGTELKVGGNISTPATVTAGTHIGNFPGLRSGDGASNGGPGSAPSALNPAASEGALAAKAARLAEVKPMNDKINILATWSNTASYPLWQPNVLYVLGDVVVYETKLWYCVKQQPPLKSFEKRYWKPYDPEDKFKRKSQPVQTTTSRFPTYEPCPEHNDFKMSSITTPSPIMTQEAKTYEGSGGPGNDPKASPPTSTTPGTNNKDVQGDPPSDSSTTKDFNVDAFECQLKIHEGVRYNSYNDHLGYLTGGIGHLLRENEKAQYPLGAPISEGQVSQWFSQDCSISIKIAQELLGDTWSDLSDVRKRACADLAFNLGKPRFSKFNNFLSAMKAGKFDVAGAELKNSRWFTQVGRRGPNIVTMIVQDVDPNGCDKKFPA